MKMNSHDCKSVKKLFSLFFKRKERQFIAVLSQVGIRLFLIKYFTSNFWRVLYLYI